METNHYHLLFRGNVDITPGSLSEGDLKKSMEDLLEPTDTTRLIEARVKLSKLNAWSGFMAIDTSHVAFHYWIDERCVQFDRYSRKKFDPHKTIEYLKRVWRTTSGSALFIYREKQQGFNIERLHF